MCRKVLVGAGDITRIKIVAISIFPELNKWRRQIVEKK